MLFYSTRPVVLSIMWGDKMSVVAAAPKDGDGDGSRRRRSW